MAGQLAENGLDPQKYVVVFKLTQSVVVVFNVAQRVSMSCYVMCCVVLFFVLILFFVFLRRRMSLMEPLMILVKRMMTVRDPVLYSYCSY